MAHWPWGRRRLSCWARMALSAALAAAASMRLSRRRTILSALLLSFAIMASYASLTRSRLALAASSLRRQA